MLSLNRIIKFLWFVSLFLFLAILFYGYYLLPDTVCYLFSENGLALDYIARDAVFYFFIGAVGIFNLLFLVVERYAKPLSILSKHVSPLRAWHMEENGTEQLKLLISSWATAYAAAVNASAIIVFAVFWKVNTDLQASILQYGWTVWPVLVLAVLPVVWLVLALSLKKTN